MVSASPRLHRRFSPAREDSCIEPRAYPAALWPFRGPTSIASSLSPSSSSRRLPRTLTTQLANLRSSAIFALEHSFEFSELNDAAHPVPISSGLSPSLREALPHPTPLRAPSPPVPSDLSAASTRAVTEPHTLRDLRRVTAPLSMMDPWQYDTDFLAAADCHRPRSDRKSASSHPSQRLSDRAPRPSHLSDARRWKFYPKFLDRKLSRRRRQRPDFLPRTVIPDRLQDAFVASDPQYQSYAQPETMHPNTLQQAQTAHLLLPYTPIRDDSVLTAVTAESANESHQELSRRRADSEPARRRSISFLSRRDSVFSLWDRFWKRRRTTQNTRTSPASEPNSSASRRSGKLSRLRKLDFRLMTRPAA